MVISGSGPTILCVLRREEAEGFVTRMGRVLEPLEDHWVCHILDCDREGARVI